MTLKLGNKTDSEGDPVRTTSLKAIVRDSMLAHVYPIGAEVPNGARWPDVVEQCNYRFCRPRRNDCRRRPASTVVKTIGVGGDPAAASSVGTSVWGENHDDDTMTEPDASTGTLVRTINLCRSLGQILQPDGISSDARHPCLGIDRRPRGGGGTMSEPAAPSGLLLQCNPTSNPQMPASRRQ
jgi:hypothetical protein